jgi:hypothetical protein
MLRGQRDHHRWKLRPLQLVNRDRVSWGDFVQFPRSRISPPEKLVLPFPLFVDEDGVHRRLGATDSEGEISPALYITDRYGEVFAAYRSTAGQGMPRAGELLNWLAFINSQCPECESPEWPL